jgi:hypothetical protein
LWTPLNKAAPGYFQQELVIKTGPLLLRIDYDDQPDDVVNKANVALEPLGIQFVLNEPACGDGFMIYDVVQKQETGHVRPD